VLREEVAGEDVRLREVADRLPEVDDRNARLVGRRVLEVKVQRREAPFRIEVVENHLLPPDLDGLGRALQESVEERRVEARERDGEVLELLDVGEPPRPRVPEDEPVLVENVPTAPRLRGGGGIAGERVNI